MPLAAVKADDFDVGIARQVIKSLSVEGLCVGLFLHLADGLALKVHGNGAMQEIFIAPKPPVLRNAVARIFYDYFSGVQRRRRLSTSTHR